MDEFFMGVDDKFSVSMVDSTMMSILHSAMNKAHAKVQSKEGVIERFNEQSKFYELAIMQLEACLMFVQEEAGNYILETTHKRLLFDLLEMKDKLEERLKETEAAIVEKDKELLERLENETRLRQTLEAKEQELQCHKKSKDHTKDGNFNELKHSVDKHVYNIKQHLEGERIALTKRLSQEISPATIVESLDHIDVTKSHLLTKRESLLDPIRVAKSEFQYDHELDMGFGRMGLEVDSLKKTLDTTFEVMSSIISRSGDHPLEVQWAWRIEKDMLSLLLKEFVVNHQIENLHVKTKFEENKSVSSGPLCIQTWSNFIDDMTLLQDELEGVILSYEAKEKHLSHHYTHYDVLMHDDNLPKLVDKEFQKAKSKLENIQCFENNYESKIRKTLKKVLQRMDDFRTWIIRLDPSISNNSPRYERKKCSKRDEKNEKEIEDRHLIAQHHYEVEQHMKKLNLQFLGAKNTKRLAKDFEIRLDEHIVENLIKEDIHTKLLKETIKDMNLCSKIISNESSNLLEDCTFESNIKEGILCLFLKTIIHDCETRTKGDYALLTNKQEHYYGYGEDSSSQEQQISETNSHLQKTNQEEVKTVFLKEMQNLWTSKDTYEYESSIRESIQWCIILEAIKHFELYATNTPKITHVNRMGSLIEELDSLLSHYDSEKIKISKSKDDNGHMNNICIEVEEDVIDKTYEELKKKNTLLVKSTSTSEKTLHRMRNDDMIGDKLNYNIQENPLLSDSTKQMIDRRAILFDYDFLFIQEFLDQMINLEVMLQKKLNISNLRLEKLNNQLKPLIHQITSHKRRKLVYKTAFILRCRNLQKAEIEVDILGDKVDALTALLKRIYSTFDHYSIVLQQFPEVWNMRMGIKNLISVDDNRDLKL